MSSTEFAISVTADDPKKKEKKQDDPKKPDKDTDQNDELSEEDLQLRSELEMLVERLKESNNSLYRPALETLRTLIRTSTSSMTSVPKPLKFLRPHYPDLQALYDTWDPSDDKALFADILSVLAMTYSDTEPRGTLRYRLLSSQIRPNSNPGDWGHEYVRHLAAELGEEFEARQLEQETKVPGTLDDLKSLAKECSVFLLNHNAEPDAVDLLQELEMIEDIVPLVDQDTFDRVCQYMTRCVSFLPPPDDIIFLQTTHKIYLTHQKFPQAMTLAIRLNDRDLVYQDFVAAGNPLMKRQLAFMIARAQIPIEWIQSSSDDSEEEIPEELLECLSNTRLSQSFRFFGKEMGVADPKSLEDIYKSHLENTRSSSSIDSARANLASTFVNAFVNAGFGNDKLMVEADEGSSWIYKNKDHGMMAASASLGLSLIWDTEMGLTHIDKYTYSPEEWIKAGCYLAIGLVNSSVRTETDAALALLSEHVENKSVPLKTGAIMGLGLAYAGTQREEVLALLLPFISSDDTSMEIASLAALALGFVFVGSENGDITGSILQMIMERAEIDEGKALTEKWARFLCLGLGLLYLGQQSSSDATLETLKAIEHPISKTAQVIVEACAFAGTTNVLRVQKMLHECDEHIVPEDKKDEKKDEEKKEEEPPKPKEDTFQSFAVLAIALISMGEEIGSQMSLRQFNHLMHYGEPTIRRAVPLAIGLVSASNPQLPILDTLSKYSHDNDLGVALNAIFAMGLVGAGSNNARLAQMLRQLAGYYHKEPDCLFMVRVAQGLVHMGKGTIGVNPFFADRTVMHKPAVAGLLAVLTAFTDAKGFILDKYHWMLYFLSISMYPRFMITLDEKLEHIPVTVRVGQAVDVVGQAGKPRTISGFQTHETPVRLATTERAELATEEYIPFADNLEGFVILQKNPGWEQEDKMEL